jgi:hypothetical protein
MYIHKLSKHLKISALNSSSLIPRLIKNASDLLERDE